MASRLRRLVCVVKGHDPVPMFMHATRAIPSIYCNRCGEMWHAPAIRRESSDR